MNETTLPFPFLFRHFWLLVGLFWVAITFLPGAISRDISKSRSAVSRRRVGVLIMAICMPFWLLQLSAGPALTPFVSDWPVLQRWLALGIASLALVGLTAWVFSGGGARTLSLAFSVNERQVKALVALALAVSMISAIIAFTIGGEPFEALLRESGSH